MKIECQHCHKVFIIPDERLESVGKHISFPCPACKNKIELNPGEEMSPQAPVSNSEQPSQPRINNRDLQQAGPGTCELLKGEALKRNILRSLQDLPPMPEVAHKARKVVSDESSSFNDLARVIETDQAIAARVLKLSNSSFYGVRGTITSIQHASVVLGMKTLNEMLTLACAASVLGEELKGYGQASEDLWKHSLAVAGCSKLIASDKNPELADDAFSAGLIHDCGKLLLDKYIEERRNNFSEYLQAGDKTFLQAEKSILGFEHAELAGSVCDKWKIPKKLSIAIQYHHSPSKLEVNELANIVHAADAIALMSGIGSGIDGMKYQLDPAASEFLGLDNDLISRYMLDTVEYVKKTLMEF